MSPDLVVRVTSSALDHRRAGKIADSKWPTDSLPVAAGRFSHIPGRWFGGDRRPGELLIGAHDILHDEADWNASTWLFDPAGVPRFVSTLNRLFDLLPDEFEIEAAWVGDKAVREQEVTRSELLAIISDNSLGNGVLYRVAGEP